jgi:hypothetical protein
MIIIIIIKLLLVIGGEFEDGVDWGNLVNTIMDG